MIPDAAALTTEMPITHEEAARWLVALDDVASDNQAEVLRLARIYVDLGRADEALPFIQLCKHYDMSRMP